MKSIVRNTASRPRLGFTLVELMVVIAIIIVLIGLLLVAVNSAFGRVDTAEVQTEIADLSNGVNQFQKEFGPPSSGIRLYERAGAWDAKSVTRIRRMFGSNFNFNKNRDFNGNGTIDANPHVLTGPECLVFFLGGMPRVGDRRHLTGFSKNPTDPFAYGGTNRVGPFFDFKASRLVDVDQDGFWEYVDPLEGQTTPYMYLVDYATGGYPSTATGNEIWELKLGSIGMNEAYYESTTKPHLKGGFQIISPGEDASWGPGGNSDPALFSGARGAESDNITNFSKGTLGD